MNSTDRRTTRTITIAGPNIVAGQLINEYAAEVGAVRFRSPRLSITALAETGHANKPPTRVITANSRATDGDGDGGDIANE